MQVKVLAEGAYQIVAVAADGVCEAEEFMSSGEESTKASRAGLQQMLEHIAEVGTQEMPQAWSHEASKRDKIYEFTKGSLRLFYFKGRGRQVVVCTSGVRKQTQKADKAAVRNAAAARVRYEAAVDAGTIEVIE